MYWNNFEGGHEATAVPGASTTWLFAEGATGGFFDSFFLFGNAGTRTANLTMTYQLSNGQTVVLHRQVGPSSRLTINAATEDPALAATTFSLAVSSDTPITAERSMFWDRSLNGNWYEAHNTFGTLTPSLKWGLAEGRVGQQFNFHTYILLANPQTTAAQVQVTFVRENGTPVVKTYTVPATSRFNIDSFAVTELHDESFGAFVEVTNNVPIIVERTMWFPGPTPAQWREAHNSFGVTDSGLHWGLAEGRVGGPHNFHTYILLANPMYWDSGGVLFKGGTNATAVRLP